MPDSMHWTNPKLVGWAPPTTTASALLHLVGGAHPTAAKPNAMFGPELWRPFRASFMVADPVPGRCPGL